MDRSPEFQAHQGLTLYFLGKLHSGLKKLSAYYRQRGVKVFNVTTPEELERALSLSRPHAVIIDLQSRSDITRFFDVLGQYDGLLEMPRVAIISSTTDQDTAEALMQQADESVVWPLKATDLSLKLFNLLASRGQFVRFQRDVRDEEGRFYRGDIYPAFLRDVLQLLYLGRKDAILSLESEGRRGNLYFKEGKLIDAQVGALEWEDSLELVRRFKSGTFVLSFQPVDRKKFIEKNVAAWLAQQDEDGEMPPAPEPGDATAIGATDPDVTVPRATSRSSEDSDNSGVILGGAAAVTSSESTRSGERFAGETPADPMTTTPQLTPAAAAVGMRPTPRPADAAPARPVLEPTPPPQKPQRETAPVPPPSQVAPPPAEARGREVRVAIGMLLLAVGLLGGIWYYRSLPEKTVSVAQTEPAPPPATPVPMPDPTPVKVDSRVREITTPDTPAPLPSEVKIREVPEPIKPPEEPRNRVREIVGTPTPAPRTVAKADPIKPVATPRPAATPKPEPTRTEMAKPAPTPVPTPVPTPAPIAVARIDTTPKTSESMIDIPVRERPDKNLRKARELEKAGKLQEALAIYTQVAELDPSSREASEAIGRLRGTPEISPMAPGELHINAFPYGIVYVDGEKQGYTPVHLMKATPRKYLIRVVNPDLGACSTEVVIKPGERKWVHLRLDDDETCQRSRSTP